MRGFVIAAVVTVLASTVSFVVSDALAEAQIEPCGTFGRGCTHDGGLAVLVVGSLGGLTAVFVLLVGLGLRRHPAIQCAVQLLALIIYWVSVNTMLRNVVLAGP